VDDLAADDKRVEVAAFRYGLVRHVLDPSLTPRQRGHIVRRLAGEEYVDPFGRRIRVSRQTLDRWIRAWRRGGFEGLMPEPRRVSYRTPDEMLTLAARVKAEDPSVSATQIVPMLRACYGWAPSVRTLQRYLASRSPQES